MSLYSFKYYTLLIKKVGLKALLLKIKIVVLQFIFIILLFCLSNLKRTVEERRKKSLLLILTYYAKIILSK